MHVSQSTPSQSAQLQSSQSQTALSQSHPSPGNQPQAQNSQPDTSAPSPAQAPAPAQAASSARDSNPLRAEVNAPVRNFRLPVFDEEGHRQWDLQGAQAQYIDRNEIRVEDMTLRTYSPDDPLHPRMLIQSPSANIHPIDSVATGPGYLFITEANNNYFIIGRNWTWDGRGEKVSIKEDVRVTFREKVDRIMD